jgi:hypothetical protein
MSPQIKWIDPMKAEVHEQALKGDTSNIWDTFKGLTNSISSRVSGNGQEPEDVEANLHLLWYILLQGARNLSPESFGQYHMVYTIAQLRELGVSRQTMENAKETTNVGGQKLWTGLPYLLKDVEAEWNSSDATLTETEKRNLTSFLAKMLAIGIFVDELAGLAVDSFSKAPLEDSESLSTESLQMILMWFKYAGDKLTELSNDSLHWTRAKWTPLHEKLAKLTMNDDGTVAVATMEAYLQMYECVWRTDNPMRPARDMHEDQLTHVEFLGEFCDRFPDLAKPG